MQNRRIGIILLKDNSITAMQKEHLKNERKLNHNEEIQPKKNKKITDIGENSRDSNQSLIPDPLSFQ